MPLFLQAVFIFIFVYLCFPPITERTCMHFQGESNSHRYNLINPEVSAREATSIFALHCALVPDTCEHFLEQTK